MTIAAFNLPLMENLSQELDVRAHSLKVVHCFPNDLHRFYIQLQGGNEKQEALFFSLQPPFLRFHLIQSTPLPKQNTSHPLFFFLQDAILQRAKLLGRDRILQLTFMTPQGERKLITEFFEKHPNYYLVKPDGLILFAMHPLPHNTYQLPTSPLFRQETAQWQSHAEVELAYARLEKQWEFNQEKQSLARLLTKELKNLERKVQALSVQLQECEKWEIVQHEGDLIKSNLVAIHKGVERIFLHDWVTQQQYELRLNPAKTAQEEMIARYKKAKKLLAGKSPLSQQLALFQSRLDILKNQLLILQQTESSEELQKFKITFPPQIKQVRASSNQRIPSSPIYREYHSETGVKIWVGKTAKANEQLTFQLANGRDWWLHVRGYPGSHVIIRLGKQVEPDTETLKDALQLALHHSQAKRQGEGEVDYTLRKYVSRFGKGKTGQVQISKHKTAWIRFDPERLQALKERSFNSQH